MLATERKYNLGMTPACLPAPSSLTHSQFLLSMASCCLLQRNRFQPLLKVTSYRKNPFVVTLFNENLVFQAYVNSSFGGNYFALDWNALAGSQLIEYPLIIGNVSPVAKHVQQFISWLVQSHGLDLAGVHILGLSLGAHLAGQVGKAIQKTDGFKVARITGMELIVAQLTNIFFNRYFNYEGFDPAGPLFWPANPSVNINKDDAHFVDIIHSNQGLYGEKTTEGHVDFIRELTINLVDLHGFKLNN